MLFSTVLADGFSVAVIAAFATFVQFKGLGSRVFHDLFYKYMSFFSKQYAH